MQGLRHQFFTRTRFPIDEHRDIRTGQPPYGAKNLLHGRRFTDDLKPPYLLLIHRLRMRKVLPAGAANLIDRLIHIEGFRQILKGALMISRDCAFEI